MNVSRRLVSRRLVAMLVVGFVLAGASAFAQTQKLRVKLGPANIYERPRTSSDVVMVAAEGTILEVLTREDTWFWVYLPRDGNGQRRAGYIASYLVELISPTGPDAMPRSGMSALAQRPPVVKPSRPPGDRTSRYLIGINQGTQTAGTAFGDTVSFPQYDESVHASATYATPKSSGFDATLGFRLSPRFGVAVAFWRSTPSATASLTASVPRFTEYNSPRLTSGATGVNRLERDGHLQLTWFVPLSNRAELAIFGGPSLFYVKQSLVQTFSWPENFPYDTVTISRYNTIANARTTIGVNAGADVTIMVWRYFGVGVGGRYARGSMTMPSADGTGTVTLQVGGPQISAGLRMRF